MGGGGEGEGEEFIVSALVASGQLWDLKGRCSAVTFLGYTHTHTHKQATTHPPRNESHPPPSIIHPHTQTNHMPPTHTQTDHARTHARIVAVLCLSSRKTHTHTQNQSPTPPQTNQPHAPPSTHPHTNSHPHPSTHPAPPHPAPTLPS